MSRAALVPSGCWLIAPTPATLVAAAAAAAAAAASAPSTHPDTRTLPGDPHTP